MYLRMILGSLPNLILCQVQCRNLTFKPFSASKIRDEHLSRSVRMAWNIVLLCRTFFGLVLRQASPHYDSTLEGSSQVLFPATNA